MAALQRCERFVHWWTACLLIQLQRIFKPVAGSLQSTEAWLGLEGEGKRGVLGQKFFLEEVQYWIGRIVWSEGQGKGAD